MKLVNSVKYVTALYNYNENKKYTHNIIILITFYNLYLEFINEN